MRIDLLGPAAVSTERTGATANTGSQATAKTVPEDTATLSPGSLSVPSLATQALQEAEARLAKVGALSRAVSSGAYTLDPGLIAQAIASSGV
jgi:anti-sigma28 factor (negative regulator of flagellin synthesis)